MNRSFVLKLPNDYTFESGYCCIYGWKWSGKSTLLNCIAGLNESNTIRMVLKRPGIAYNLKCPASAVVAYLEAHPSLLEIYSVREYETSGIFS